MFIFITNDGYRIDVIKTFILIIVILLLFFHIYFYILFILFLFIVVIRSCQEKKTRNKIILCPLKF